jgi:hypothetical protein
MSELNNTINANNTTPLPVNAGGFGVSSPTANAVLISEGSSAFSSIALSTGQVLIGTTSGDPLAATLTAGTNISITNGSGSITIASTGGGGSLTWNSVTGSTQTLVANNAYVQNSSSNLVTYTLPTTANIGDTIIVTANYFNNNSGAWQINVNSGQHITYVATQTTSSGYLAGSTGATVTLVCVVANTTFTVISFYGTSVTTH